MTLAEYAELEERAEKVGDYTLFGVGAVIAIGFLEGFSARMSELRAWENNIAKEVERRIKEVEADD